MSGFDPKLMSSTSSFAGNSTLNETSAIANLTNTANPYSAPVYDRSTQAMLSPDGNVIPANTPQGNISAMDQQIASSGKEAMLKQQQQTNPNMFGNMMLSRQLLNQGQPQMQHPQLPQGDVRRGQQVNMSDSVTALLAPKLKKKQPISLL